MSNYAPLRRKSVNYAKWGYIFILPFFITYAIFSLYPLVMTFYYSFFEMYRIGLDDVGPNFVGLANFKAVLVKDTAGYFWNTFVIWVMGFIPQIFFSLLFASWFTDLRLKLKATGFFKVIIYLPNIIMASSISMLFFALFSDIGPINNLLSIITGNDSGGPVIRFFTHTGSVRGIIAFINFLMWYGNTTILLMSGILGIDTSLYESAQIDGANSRQTFTKITLPLLKPILLFVLITSLIGGLQMFDIPQILTNGKGDPVRSTMTVVMFLNNYLFSRNYGMAGAISVILFIVAAALSLIVFFTVNRGSVSKKGGK